jgi:hypothetical protein
MAHCCNAGSELPGRLRFITDHSKTSSPSCRKVENSCKTRAFIQEAVAIRETLGVGGGAFLRHPGTRV